MALVRSAAIPPRRPSHVVRYILPAAVLLLLFYYLSGTSRASITPIYDPGSPSSQSGSAPGSGRPDSAGSIDQAPIRPENGGAVDLDHGDDTLNKKPPLDKKPDQQPPHSGSKSGQSGSTGDNPSPPKPPKKRHPIDDLIKLGNDQFDEILSKKSNTLAEAAEAYRKRRGRHPPPGFDVWYKFAVDNDAVMVEDFFDQIYHDLNPFWGVEPGLMRKEAYEYEMTINVRNKTASARSDWFWTQIWLNLTSTIEHMLPDMDIALNAMDEPRLVVPWETVNDLMRKEQKSRKLVSPRKVISEFEELPAPEEMRGLSLPPVQDKNWEDTSTSLSLSSSFSPSYIHFYP